VTKAPSPSSRRISWRRLAVEGLAVVASILIAFAIDAWWDGRQEARTRSAELANLRSDFGQARAELAEKRMFHLLIAEAAAELRTELARSPEGVPMAVPDTLVIPILGLPNLDIANASLEELEMSASISRVRDSRLRAAVVAWPRIVRDVFNEEAASTRLTEGTLIPHLRRTTDLTPAWDLLPTWVSRHLQGRRVGRDARSSLDGSTGLSGGSWVGDPVLGPSLNRRVA
jgi:hypothetical protein